MIQRSHMILILILILIFIFHSCATCHNLLNTVAVDVETDRTEGAFLKVSSTPLPPSSSSSSSSATSSLTTPNLTFEREEEVKGVDFCGQTFARPAIVRYLVDNFSGDSLEVESPLLFAFLPRVVVRVRLEGHPLLGAVHRRIVTEHIPKGPLKHRRLCNST